MTTETKKKATRILVVDDNKEFCENVKDVLEIHGYKASTAYSGLSAIDLVKQDPPDIILLDVKMPGLDGVETFKTIKQSAPQIAVVMMTGYALEERIREAIREGARAFLKKPLDFNQLFRFIESAS